MCYQHEAEGCNCFGEPGHLRIRLVESGRVLGSDMIRSSRMVGTCIWWFAPNSVTAVVNELYQAVLRSRAISLGHSCMVSHALAHDM